MAQADAIDQTMQEFVEPGGPGCTLAVGNRTDVIFERSWGLASIEHGIPIGPETVFDVGSVSKQFVAAAAGMLALRESLDLEAEARTYLPELSQFETDPKVRHLIAHSAGFADVYRILELLGHETDGNFYPSELTLEMTYRMKSLEFTPGARWEYSNNGYLLLSQVVERTSGQSLREFTRLNIFEPLGMHDTHFHDNYREIVPHRASGYGKTEDGQWEVRNSNFYVVGDGGLYTTARDLLTWDRNFYDSKLEGGQQLVEMMLQPNSYSEKRPFFIGREMDYGFGIFIDQWEGLERFWHAGGWAGYGSVLSRFPERELSVVMLCNQRKPGLGQAYEGILKALLP